MHYTTANPADRDQTSVDFQFGERPAQEAHMLELRDDKFKVPPGAKSYYDNQTRDIGADFAASTIYSVFPHMHFFGKEISISVLRHSGETETLIDIQKWNYAWQGMYFLVNPVHVQPGDQLRIACTFDNSEENQPTALSGTRMAPRELHWGPSALDEMCLAYLYVTGGTGIVIHQ
jgi:hypothetical protein